MASLQTAALHGAKYARDNCDNSTRDDRDVMLKGSEAAVRDGRRKKRQIAEGTKYHFLWQVSADVAIVQCWVCHLMAILTI